jgi:hypothetical protein
MLAPAPWPDLTRTDRKIAFYLHARDIGALVLSCKFQDIVAGSVLLPVQCLYRTELTGVYEPLQDLS